MRSKLIAIGKARGVRLPQTLIDEAGLSENVEIRAENGRIVIESAPKVREGWEKAAAAARVRGDKGLVDEPTDLEFGEKEWRW